MIYYDLHIHSCLSPCANDDMTGNNIVNMSIIKGLDYISVTDHNSLKQQATLGSVAKILGIGYIYGVEIESSERVHVLIYLTKYEKVIKLQSFLDKHLVYQKNDAKYYGNQLILDDLDQVVGSESNLLIRPLDVSLREIIAFARTLEAKVVLAHIFDRRNSITYELGSIPSDLDFDGYEVKSHVEQLRALKEYPFLSKKTCFISSDAHYLINIKEKENPMGKEEFLEFFGLEK